MRGEGPALGLRADMDALPIQEATGLPYASQVDGVMHACGHDGHTAMLLAAARHLVESPHWRGTLQLIFQPAEEGLGGARAMLDDGLLERFPCDAIFAMHNVPGYPVGHLGFHPGPFMASADTVVIRVIGSGGHGAVPQRTVDPVVVCSAIVLALQSIVSRNVDPQDTAIVSVGAIHAGTVSNVIPASAEMILSVRALTRKPVPCWSAASANWPAARPPASARGRRSTTGIAIRCWSTIPGRPRSPARWPATGWARNA